MILKKLESYREGGSEKHLRDIVGVLKVSGAEIDHEYIDDWSRRLGVDELWRSILARLGDSG